MIDIIMYHFPVYKRIEYLENEKKKNEKDKTESKINQSMSRNTHFISIILSL